MTINLAHKAARVNEKKYSGIWSAYFCHDCGDFHIGHAIGKNPPRAKVMRRKRHNFVDEVDIIAVRREYCS